jgi:metal-dependent HD superfamily phosphatase/phosphodiesterase
MANANAETIRSTLEGQTHIRNVSSNSPTTGYQDWGSIHAVPIKARAGSLCAVILKGGVKYYVWRRTAESRSGFDYDRNQAAVF